MKASPRGSAAVHRAPAARDYVVGAQIAEGLDGDVFAARRRRDDAEVVIKAARGSASGARNLCIEAEALWLGRFASPHVVPLIDEVMLDGRAALVLPRAPLGSLAGAIAQLSTPALLGAVRDTLVALTHLHAAEVVHLDVKPSNVLLTYDDNGFVIAQLADLSRAAKAAWGLRAQAFTPRYAAPELRRGRSVTASVDVFALGMWLVDRALDRGVTAWVARATDADPRARFAHAGKAYAALAEVVDLPALGPALTRAFDSQPRVSGTPPVGDETVPFDQPLALGHAVQSARATPLGPSIRGRCSSPLRARDGELARIRAWMREGSAARFIALEGPRGVGATRLGRVLTTSALLEGAQVMRLGEAPSEITTWPATHPAPLDLGARTEWLRAWVEAALASGDDVVLLARASTSWALPALRAFRRERRLSVICDATGMAAGDALPWTHHCALDALSPEQLSRILTERGVEALEAARIALASGGLPARALMILRGGVSERGSALREAPRPIAQTLRRLLALLAMDGPQRFPRFRLRAVELGIRVRSEHLAYLLRWGVYDISSATLSLPSALEGEIPRSAWRAVLPHAHPDADDIRVARVGMHARIQRVALERLERIPRESLPASDLVTFDAVLSRLSASPRAEALRALTAYLRGDNLAAKRHVESALASRSRSVRVHALLTRGQVALSALDVEAARHDASLAGALAEHSDDELRAALLRARIDILTGQTRAAARLLRRVLAPLTEKARATPLALRAASLLADAYSNEKLPLSAIRLARATMHRAARAHAPMVRLIAANTLVDSLVQCARYGEAVEVGKTLSESASGPVAHYLAGNVAMAEVRRGELDAALRLLNDALLAVGSARHRLWAFLAAVKALALSMRSEPDALEAWLGAMAPEAALLRDVHDAATLLDEVRARAPSSVDRWLPRG